MYFLGPWGFESPNPLPGLIRTTLEQHRVHQVGNAHFDALEKPIYGPVIDVF